jgi:hypothetical protein
LEVPAAFTKFASNKEWRENDLAQIILRRSQAHLKIAALRCPSDGAKYAEKPESCSYGLSLSLQAITKWCKVILFIPFLSKANSRRGLRAGKLAASRN